MPVSEFLYLHFGGHLLLIFFIVLCYHCIQALFFLISALIYYYFNFFFLYFANIYIEIFILGVGSGGWVPVFSLLADAIRYAPLIRNIYYFNHM